MSEESSDVQYKSSPSYDFFKDICPVSLGMLSMGVRYPNPSLRPSEAEIISMITQAASIVSKHNQKLLIDTANVYCDGPKDIGAMESLLGQITYSLSDKSNNIIIATKGGLIRTGVDSNNAFRPARFSFNVLEAQIQNSFQAINSFKIKHHNNNHKLNQNNNHDNTNNKDPDNKDDKGKESESLKKIDLWQVHHVPEPKVMIEPLKQILENNEAEALKDKNCFKHFGICNATIHHIQEILKSFPSRASLSLCSIQNEYGFYHRQPEEPAKPQAKTSAAGIFSFCSQFKITFLAIKTVGGLDARRGTKNLLEDFPALTSVFNKRINAKAQAQAQAQAKETFSSPSSVPDCSPYSIYFAYLIHRASRMGVKLIVISGARQPKHAVESINGAYIKLTKEEIKELDEGWNSKKNKKGKNSRIQNAQTEILTDKKTDDQQNTPNKKIKSGN